MPELLLPSMAALFAQQAAESNFWSWISQSDVIFWIAIALIVIVPASLYAIAEMRRDHINAELKRDMIARGMSAEEIERVLKAEKE